jgi:hypothetical protein
LKKKKKLVPPLRPTPWITALDFFVAFLRAQSGVQKKKRQKPKTKNQKSTWLPAFWLLASGGGGGGGVGGHAENEGLD